MTDTAANKSKRKPVWWLLECGHYGLDDPAFDPPFGGVSTTLPCQVCPSTRGGRPRQRKVKPA